MRTFALLVNVRAETCDVRRSSSRPFGAVAAGNAPEHRLALAAGRCDVAADQGPEGWTQLL